MKLVLFGLGVAFSVFVPVCAARAETAADAIAISIEKLCGSGIIVDQHDQSGWAWYYDDASPPAIIALCSTLCETVPISTQEGAIPLLFGCESQKE